MSQAIFSIVARNYLPMAKALGNSIDRFHANIPFYIIVADHSDDFENNGDADRIIDAKRLDIPKFEEMSFKYDITEFCTSLKPFCFDYLFNRGYEKVIYFDPDIFVFSSLDNVFEQLSNSSIVMTPHLSIMQSTYTGLVPEGMLMHVGIFNFGFCAINSSVNGRKIVDWWKIRLTDQCYADKTDGLHTDQKWMDFVPSFITNAHIERGLGYNLAIWNWHERKIEIRDNEFWVVARDDNSKAMPLVFFHFSNFHFTHADTISAFKPKYIRKFDDLSAAVDEYASELVAQKISYHAKRNIYKFSAYDNGVKITHFHRRMYRRLIDNGHIFINPFSSQEKNSFYNLLYRSKLLDAESTSVGKVNEENFSGFDRKLYYIQKVALIVKRLIGINRYALLCKFALRFLRPENQLFLIKELKNKIPFYNENRYLNW
jgi:lipopolysaccharide biosynthesis glycosyltransferase